MNSPQHTLKKSISEISFYRREKNNNQYVKNKCGRDFIYYVLNYHYPEKFNAEVCNPKGLDANKFLGQPVFSFLAWTQIQFSKIHIFLQEFNLQLKINDKEIKSFFNFVQSILFSRKTYEQAICDIENCINQNVTCGIDISLGMGGLLDHVLFVYGYDDDNLYVFDTHKVSNLEYVPIDESEFLFKLPKNIIKKRWTKFGRVWTVKEI